MAQTPDVESARLVPRWVGALRLRSGTYAGIASDPRGAPQAAIVVLSAAALEVGASTALHGETALVGGRLALALVAGLIGWTVWTVLLYGVGSRAFRHEISLGAVARGVGLAHAPGLLMGLALLPGAAILAGSLYLLSIVWFVATLFAATRGLFDVAPTRAVTIVAITCLAHEVVRQAVRLAGLA